MVKRTRRKTILTLGEKIIYKWGLSRNSLASDQLLDYVEKGRPKDGYESPRGIEWGELAKAIDKELDRQRNSRLNARHGQLP
jgi:hypothetical protein